jgi:hypothetical protein
MIWSTQSEQGEVKKRRAMVDITVVYHTPEVETENA